MCERERERVRVREQKLSKKKGKERERGLIKSIATGKANNTKYSQSAPQLTSTTITN